MTPLHLDILNHYYTGACDYELVPENPTRTAYAYGLAQLGLLYTPANKEQIFLITEHGKRVFEKILAQLEELTASLLEGEVKEGKGK